GAVCLQALDFFVAAQLRRREVLCRLLLARIAYAGGQFLIAKSQCEAAWKILSTLEAPLLSYHAHLILGDLHQTAGIPLQAYNSYQNARRDLEGLRGSVQGEELRIAFMKNRVEVYEKLVDLCLNGGPERTDEAFGYIEQAKSRILAECVCARRNPLLVAAR